MILQIRSKQLRSCTRPAPRTDLCAFQLLQALQPSADIPAAMQAAEAAFQASLPQTAAGLLQWAAYYRLSIGYM